MMTASPRVLRGDVALMLEASGPVPRSMFDGMPARFKDLCVDALDHQALADWWCQAFGYERRDTDREPDWPVPLIDRNGAGPLIWINPVPELKSVKNRLHIDVVGQVEDLLALGATVVREPAPHIADDDIEWTVMADPEGNEFCVFPLTSQPSGTTPS
jgi:hypothetical protein